MASTPSQDNVPINPIHHVEDEVRYEVENCTSRILLQFDSEFDIDFNMEFEIEFNIEFDFGFNFGGGSEPPYTMKI